MKFLASVSLVVLCLSVAAFGTTYLVPSQYTTIQAAINASSNGDTVLVAAGTYSGTGNKALDYGGRNIVVMSETGAENTIIDCQGSGNGAYFHTAETEAAVFAGFTIKSGSNTYGGGIRINNASPTVERCIIRNNSGSYGGGIYVNGGNPVFLHNTIVANSATNGGAMYATGYANPVISSNIIATNTASG
ncbi:hypothetical protein KKA00_00930 [bacterium]|nr:hypothetical protein [bacterium]